MKVNITNKVFRLKKDVSLATGVTLKRGQELEIVMDVVYIGGFPVPNEHQNTFYKFIVENPNYFVDDTRIF